MSFINAANQGFRAVLKQGSMVRAWYKDDIANNQDEPHMLDPETLLDVKALENIGLLYFQILSEDYDNCAELKQLKKDRHYSVEDQITVTGETLKTAVKEHMHPDEEIRLVTSGSGYFDIRDTEDRWIRIELVKGDLLVIAGGIYHSFSLDKKKFIQIRRYFSEVTEWTAYDRPADDHASRKAYIKKYGNKSRG